MGAEKDVLVISVENLGKLIVHLVNLHLRRKRKGLDKEHAVIQLSNIWIMLFLPEDLDWLGECSWNESTVWLD